MRREGGESTTAATAPEQEDRQPRAAPEAGPAERAAPSARGGNGPLVVSEEPLAVLPSMPIGQLLGKTRADIETLFHPAREGQAAGWVRYNRHLEVRYEGDRCAELSQQVPGGLSCTQAARWMGFGDTMAPIRRARSCVWPPNSLKHALGKRISGELTLDGGVFRARLDP